MPPMSIVGVSSAPPVPEAPHEDAVNTATVSTTDSGQHTSHPSTS